jgi:hypothetical protein
MDGAVDIGRKGSVAMDDGIRDMPQGLVGVRSSHGCRNLFPRWEGRSKERVQVAELAKKARILLMQKPVLPCNIVGARGRSLHFCLE